MSHQIEIGARLKAAREQMGLNQTAFASLAGVTRNTQFLYESGSRKPDSGYLSALHAAGLDIFWILTGESNSEGLGAAETELLHRFKCITAKQQQLLLDLIAEFARQVPVARAPSLHEQQQGYRLPKTDD